MPKKGLNANYQDFITSRIRCVGADCDERVFVLDAAYGALARSFGLWNCFQSRGRSLKFEKKGGREGDVARRRSTVATTERRRSTMDKKFDIGRGGLVHANMYKGFRVICVTPAGRRRYMKLLAPYILSAAEVDRWDVWVNTADADDIQFIDNLASEFDKVNPIRKEDGVINGFKTIGWFFCTATESNTIYIRFDDDIVWIQDGFFETFLDYRINNPDHFLVFPIIINNAIGTHLLQQYKFFSYPQYITAHVYDDWGWRSPEFALKLHEWFFEQLKNDNINSIKFNSTLISLNRMSINCMSWMGDEFSKFDGSVTEEEEDFLTVIKPREMQKTNSICGNTIVSHFAFGTQRELLDRSDLLQRYELLIESNSSHEIATILNILKKISPKQSEPESKMGVKERLKAWSRVIPLPWLTWISLGECYRKFKHLRFKN